MRKARTEASSPPLSAIAMRMALADMRGPFGDGILVRGCTPVIAGPLSGGRTMDRTPLPVSLAAALALPRTPGRSAEVFVDGDLEVRFAARPTDGPQVPHRRDELYFV